MGVVSLALVPWIGWTVALGCGQGGIGVTQAQGKAVGEPVEET